MQINNSYLPHKIKIRELYTKHLKSRKVLDCFSGNQEIWSKIPHDLYIGIDKKKYNDSFILIGDNRKYLETLDLSKFNIIDLDAYGIPFEQIQIIFDNKTAKKGTIIFFTFIQLKNSFGQLPIKMLEKIGYPRTMVKKIPTLFKKNGFNKFKQFLAINGIQEINYIQFNDKIYGYFILENKE